MNQKIRFVIVTWIMFFCSGVWSAETETPQSVPSLMYLFRNSLIELAPYIGSRASFSDKANSAKIEKELKAMADVSKGLKSHELLQTDGFKVPASRVTDQLNQSYTSFKKGNRGFSWRLFTSAMNGCSQCHTQIAGKEAPALNFDAVKISGSTLDEADFWFAIRNYSKSKEMYAKVLKYYDGNVVNGTDLFRAIRRTLLVDLRIERSPQLALDFVKAVRDNPKIPSWILKDLEAYKSELINIQKRKELWTNIATTQQAETVADTLLREVYPFPKKDRSRDILAMFVSGLLLNFINEHPALSSPTLLYWIGTTADDVEDDLFLHVGDEYLKYCVEKFSHDPMAPRCLHALKEKWLFGYSGSAGTALPKDVEQELDTLQKTIDQIKK